MLAGNGAALAAVGFSTGAKARGPEPGWERNDAVFREPVRQLQEYFAGTRRTFELDLAPSGTPFQRLVLGALSAIPYGETRSYADIAREIGRPRAARAVGAANGRNPLPIVIPCHRVIGRDRSLTGFGGGLPTKRYLLDLEARVRGAHEGEWALQAGAGP